MSEEKKNVNNKELCEGRELTPEELEQVTGGGYNRKDYSAQQWKDLLLYILRQDKK